MLKTYVAQQRQLLHMARKIALPQIRLWGGIATLVRIYVLFGLPNPIFSIREIVVLCMGDSEIPYLRLWSD